MSDISILIPTHNRPGLFQRCVDSVLRSWDRYETDIEVIVNNDSCDINEIYHPDISIRYHYIQKYNLSDIYKFLISASSGKYIYILEDDDYLVPDFCSDVNISKRVEDVLFFDYISIPLITEIGYQAAMARTCINRQFAKCPIIDDFRKRLIERDFQLGQFILKKDLALSSLPGGNDVNNDIIMFRNIPSTSSLKYIEKALFVQTIDGRDNISFDALNTDGRFNTT